MMTFTYVAFISGIVSWNLPGVADSMFNRMSVSHGLHELLHHSSLAEPAVVRQVICWSDPSRLDKADAGFMSPADPTCCACCRCVTLS